jgi:secreted trypsin-like serine protease
VLGIIGGSTDTTHPSAVFIRASLGTQKGYCSGVVVAPRVVLTAAHCTSVEGFEYRIFVGDDYADGGTSIEVAERHAHPSYDPTTNAYDIGVLVTATDLPVPAAALNRSPASVGQTVSLVGYGETVAGNSSTIGKRMVGSTTITAVDAFDFTIQGTPNFCFFDSGGPAYLSSGSTEVVAGIHYVMDSASCNGHGYDVRVDRFVEFIDGYIAASVVVDAGVPVMDAGMTVIDAGSPEDAGVPANPVEPPPQRGGCSLAGTGPSGWLTLLLAAITGGWVARRRGRDRCSS